jgi:anti-anti-sigma factor
VDEAPFRLEPLDQPRTFRVSGSFSMASAGSLHEVLDELCTTPGDVTLDVSGVTFMDSGGLRAILQACSGLVERGAVRLVNPSGQVQELLRLTGVERAIPNLVVVKE